MRWSGLVGVVVWVGVGCGPKPIGAEALEGTGESSASSESSGDTIGHGVASTSEGAGQDDPDDADDDGSEGTVDESCGNGSIDPGEHCDGTVGCSDQCTWSCELGELAPQATSNPARLLFDARPLPTADATGDTILPSIEGASRMAADGTEAWIRTSWTGRYTLQLASRDAGEFWRASQDDEAGFVSRHDMATGDQLAAFEMPPSPGGPSYALAVAFAPDGGVLVQYLSYVDEMTRTVVVQRRSVDGSEVEWSTELMGEPNPQTGFNHDGAGTLFVGSDGEIYSTGKDYLDHDDNEPYIAKLDPDGALLWRRVLFPGDISARSWIADLVQLDDGDMLAIPARSYGAGASVGVIFGMDTRLVRLNGAGEELWSLDPAELAGAGQLVPLAALRRDGDVIAFAGHLRFPGEIVAAVGYLDASDGSLLCLSTVDHPDYLITMADQLFEDADGRLMVLLSADDGQQDNTISERRFFATLGD